MDIVRLCIPTATGGSFFCAGHKNEGGKYIGFGKILSKSDVLISFKVPAGFKPELSDMAKKPVSSSSKSARGEGHAVTKSSVASDPWKITIIRPAGGEPQGFSADMPDSGDMHSFSARSAHTDPQDDLLPEPQAHAAPMSLDMSGLLDELDVQDGQNYGEGGYDADGYDDQSVLAGLIDLAQASSDTSGQAEQPAEEADVTQIIQDALTEPAPQESIDLSALPEEQAPAAGAPAPVTETQPEPVAAPVPMNTGDLDLERLLQQTSTHI